MAQIAIQSFNGHSLSSYAVGVLVPLAAANNVYIAQAQADSQDSGAFTVGVRSITLRIGIRSAATRSTLEDQLRLWFRRGTRGTLTALFADDSTTYQLTCSVTSLTQDRTFPNSWVVVMETGMSDWRAVSAETDTWAPSGTSANKTLAVSGKSQTKLSFTLTPTIAPTTGYLKRANVQAVCVAGVDYGTRPICFSLDTLALVAQDAHKCQINQVGGIDAVVSVIPYDTVTGTLPTIGMGYVGMEQISWTGKTATDLTGVSRGINGTTAATHADDAEIKVSVVQADLDDLRVWNGDAEIKRWIDAPATTTTKIWFTLRLAPGYSLTLRTAVAGSGGVTELAFVVDVNHKARIAAMPTAGIVYHGNEWFAYNGKDSVNCKLTVVQRGYMGTTIEAHNAGVVVKLLAAPITITYGNASVGDPADEDEHYDDDKPIFDLNASDNSKWVYTATTGFYDLDHPSRPGSWIPTVTKLGNESETYLYTENGESGNLVAGAEVGTWLSGSTWKAENVKIGFLFASAGGIWKITHAGKKYRSGANWLSKAGLQKSTVGVAWPDVKAEAKPTTLATYASFTYSDTVVTATTITALASMFKRLRFGAWGTYAAASNVYVQLEMASATVYFVTANLPSATALSAADNITLDVTITNTTNGDAVRIVLPMMVDKVFAVDGESHIVTFDGANAHSAMALNDDSRSEFIRLEAGDNDLTITSDDMGTLDIDMSDYARRP